MKTKIPLHLLTGFLGVGKTTAIMHLLEKIGDKEYVAVIVNERGEIGIDALTISSASGMLKVMEVAGGCICCTAGAALDNALTQILETLSPDRIFMEPTGIAKPGEIIDLINSHPLRSRIDVRPVINLVDPGHFTNPEMMKLPMYRDQVEAADILVANRSDLTEGPTLMSFYNKARILFPPKGAIFATSFGRLPDNILDISFDSSHMENGNRKSKNQIIQIRENAPKHALFKETGWIWPGRTVFDYNSLYRSFEIVKMGTIGIKSRIERAKGVFHTERGWYLMELALNEFHNRLIQYRRDNRCQLILSNYREEDTERIKELLDSCISSAPGFYKEKEE